MRISADLLWQKLMPHVRLFGKKQMSKIPELKDKVLVQAQSKALGNYIWNCGVGPQMGYSFSIVMVLTHLTHSSWGYIFHPMWVCFLPLPFYAPWLLYPPAPNTAKHHTAYSARAWRNEYRIDSLRQAADRQPYRPV